MSARACPECVAPDEDPAPWCDCEADGTTYCAGPCSNRAHDPDQCPRVDWHLTDQAVQDAIARLERDPHPDCWVPIPLRWRHVQPGDVVALKDKLWEVVGTNTQDVVTVIRGGKTHSAAPDPDATVPVLVRHQEREALQIAREQLGATVVDRRV